MADNEDENVALESGNGHGDEQEYADLIADLIKKGAMADGDKIGQEGMMLLQAQPGRPSAYTMIASVPAAHEVYSKQKDMALLVDLMARANFYSRQERINFLDWVDWCNEFDVPLDNCIWWLASSRSEGGRSTEQLIEAMTSFNHRTFNYGNNKNNNRQSGGNQPKKGIFT